MLDEQRKVLKHIEANVFRSTENIRRSIIKDRCHSENFGFVGSLIRRISKVDAETWVEIMESHTSIQNIIDTLKEKGFVLSSTLPAGSFDRQYKLTPKGIAVKARFFPTDTPI